jgi:hypothetical protein
MNLVIFLAGALAAAPLAEVRGSVPTAADKAASTATEQAVPARGKPRVSRTRCAMITCEAACPSVEVKLADALATPQPAPCALRQTAG